MPTFVRSHRNIRIDFFRGLALWSIFIDHLIEGWLRAITLKNFAFCDNTEAFVLLSGLSAGIAYKTALQRNGLGFAVSKSLRRLLAIYRTHLIAALLFIAEAGLLAAWLKPRSFLQLLNLEAYAAHPFASLLDVVLLRYQPKFLDILPLYVALLLILCVALPLLGWPKLLFGLSMSLYAAVRVFALDLPPWTGAWSFNPLAWQVLFLTGVVAASLLRRKPEAYWRGWDLLAILFALFSFFESHARHLANHVPAALLIHFAVEKRGLHPFRLLNIFALAWLVWRYVPAAAHWFRSRPGRYFILLGQHPLPVFASSVLFSTFGWAVLDTHPGAAFQIVLQAAGSLAMLAVAALSARHAKAAVPAVLHPSPKLAKAVEARIALRS